MPEEPKKYPFRVNETDPYSPLKSEFIQEYVDDAIQPIVADVNQLGFVRSVSSCAAYGIARRNLASGRGRVFPQHMVGSSAYLLLHYKDRAAATASEFDRALTALAINTYSMFTDEPNLVRYGFGVREPRGNSVTSIQNRWRAVGKLLKQFLAR